MLLLEPLFVTQRKSKSRVSAQYFCSKPDSSIFVSKNEGTALLSSSYFYLVNLSVVGSFHVQFPICVFAAMACDRENFGLDIG